MGHTKRALEHLQERECVIIDPVSGCWWDTIEERWQSPRWEVRSGDSPEHLSDLITMRPEDFRDCQIRPVDEC